MLKDMTIKLGIILCLALVIRVGMAFIGPGHDEPRPVSGSGTGDGMLAEVSELRAEAPREMADFESQVQDQAARIEREKQKQLQQQAIGVSFEPGKPMVDPTPQP